MQRISWFLISCGLVAPFRLLLNVKFFLVGILLVFLLVFVLLLTVERFKSETPTQESTVDIDECLPEAGEDMVVVYVVVVRVCDAISTDSPGLNCKSTEVREPELDKVRSGGCSSLCIEFRD